MYACLCVRARLCVTETKSQSFSIILCCACDKERSVQVPEAFAVCLCSHHIYHTTHIIITFEFLFQQLFHQAIYGVIDTLPLVLSLPGLTTNQLSGNTSHRPMKIVFMPASRRLLRSSFIYMFFLSLLFVLRTLDDVVIHYGAIVSRTDAGAATMHWLCSQCTEFIQNVSAQLKYVNKTVTALIKAIKNLL